MIYCKKCETNKEADEFYSSVISKDGLTGECKECTKKRVRENRAANAEHYKAFDRARANLPHRVQARKEYSQTLQGREKHALARENYNQNHPSRRKAVNAGVALGGKDVNISEVQE